jgi:hypothetical protein
MEDHISDSESMYRGATIHHWDEAKGRFTSSLFKCRNGVSVDRQGDRENIEECVSNLNRNVPNLIAVFEVSAGTCRRVGTHPAYAPIESNVYHSHIQESPTKVGITNKKIARALKKAANMACDLR